MFSDTSCQCCLLRPPEKDLKSPYKMLGKSEVYADMLKECFEIHINASEGANGICEVCITRLRDACNFKQQVQQCQKDLQSQLNAGNVGDSFKVKEELEDIEEKDIYFLALKEELSDYDADKDGDSDRMEMAFDDVTIKKKSLAKKKGRKKRTASEKNSALKEDLSDFADKDGDSDHSIDTLDGGAVKKKSLAKKKSRKKRSTEKSNTDRQSKKLLNGPIKMTLRAFSQMEKLNQYKTATVSTITIMSENKKHQINIENVLKHSNCTPFSNKTLAGISCAYCKETYQDLPSLREHTNQSHKPDQIYDNKKMDKNNISIKIDITDLKCTICNTNFDVIANLKKHLSLEHDIRFYTDVKDYISEFKLTDGELMTCALCQLNFATFKMLLQHMNGHYRNYICDVCDMGFINKHRLKNHQRTHEVGNFKCEFCDKVFTTRVRKMCHEKYTHNTTARYTTNCPRCDQSFTSYYQRNRHMFKEHNTVAATYKCNVCDKFFILKSKLTSHIKQVHLMERNHICSECGQGFFIKQSLDEHMIRHNGEKVFKCTVCSKAYARKKTLREHMRIHNNDRRFKCGVCESAFVQKCSLKSHMLSNHSITLFEYEIAKNGLGRLHPPTFCGEENARS